MLKTTFDEEYYVADPEWFGELIQALYNCTLECKDRIFGPLYFLSEKTKIFEYNKDILQEFFQTKVL